jgi:hypothetical protein
VESALRKRTVLPNPLLKRRTRQHIIADLAANHVERVVLLCGHTAERIRHDYGIDMFVRTYDERGFVEPGYLLFQLKAAERLRHVAGGQQIAIRLETAHLRQWLDEPVPVILVVYDADSDAAYWLDVQQEIGRKSAALKWQKPARKTLRVPARQRFDRSAMEELSALKRAVVKPIRSRTGPYA